MPDAARPELRFLSDLSRGIDETPVLTSVTVIDTSSMVHLHSSHSFIPDRSIPAFSHNAHHNRSLRMQLRVVWCLHLIGDTEGPTLITGTAWLIVSNYSAFLAHRQLSCPGVLPHIIIQLLESRHTSSDSASIPVVPHIFNSTLYEEIMSETV
jgi:hypothetical protein